MSAMQQKTRWQHLVLFAAATLLLCGGIGLSIHFWGKPTRKTPPLSVAVIFLVSAVVLGIGATLSLRRVGRREELARLSAAGLFELPPGARDALVQLNARLGSHFGLSRRDLAAPILPTEPQTLDYASRVQTLPPRRPWPATLGELRDVIFDAIEHPPDAPHLRVDARQAIADALRMPAGSIRYIDTTRIPLARFLAARNALADAFARPAESIRWDARLASLIPRGRQRFIVWERLRSRAPQLPPVDLNPWVENIAIGVFLAALIAIAIPIAQSLDRNNATRIQNPSVLTQLVGRALGLVCFAATIAVLMIPVYTIGRRHAARLPKQFDTIASLAPWFDAPGAEQPWTRADVEDHVRDLVAAALNRPPSEIGAATTLEVR